MARQDDQVAIKATNLGQNGHRNEKEPSNHRSNICETAPDGGDVATHMFFLERDELYDTVKPYVIRYDVKTSVPSENIKRLLCPVTVRDLRVLAEEAPFAQSGFQVLSLASQMSYEDYGDEEKIRTIHVPEVLDIVKANFSADDVHALEHVVRRRHPTWPIATGENYDYEQPASRAHLDFTYDAVVDIIRHLYEYEAERVLAGRWQVINVWHPLRGPTRDWPLAVCDAASVDFENDAVPGDIVQIDRVTENLQIHFNENQKWFYLSNQMPSEMLVFKNADSESPHGASCGAPHASFNVFPEIPKEVRRESIEIRILVMWEG
ncbi:hypothetical protein JMJ35_006576 [Cladonia borealis]|uniref:Methyltransferase n=1 Tax=Cladonia borealis TaxID=184061 RepID=A0AA39QZV5_9LECA|nr:hypothetical protein JMJ35_006576 [Cladonia borealis]